MLTRFFNHFKTYRLYYYYNFGILIGGIVFGMYLYQIQDDTKLLELGTSILNMLSGSYIQDTHYVTSHLLSSLLYLLVIYLFALSVIAVPFLSMLLFYKGVQLGFTAMIYFYLFNTQGMLGIIMTLLPYLIFELAAYFVSFSVSYEISLSIFLTTFIKKQILNLKEVIFHLLNNMIWSLCLIVLSILTQIYILPTLFSFFIK